jgi:transposase
MSQEQILQIIAELSKLREENGQLKEENAYLKFKLEEFNAKRYKSNKTPPADSGVKSEAPSEPKKPGGKPGHPGWFRRKPDKIDRVEDVRLACCPQCGSKDITACKNKKIDEHVQEDIILPKVEAVLYRHHEYYCKGCKNVVSSLGKDEMANSYIGPRAKALAVFLRYGVKVSERDVKNLFEKAFNLNIVHSSIAGFRDQLRRAGSPLYEALKEAIRRGSFTHIDETGWNLNGDNQWLWKFSNKKVCVSHIDKSRGQKVVEDIMGNEYDGIIISDFLSAYNKIGAKGKQRCLVHLLRDLKKVKRYWHDDEEVLQYINRLKKIIEDAIELYKEYKSKPQDQVYLDRRESLENSIKDFAFPNPNKRVLKRFANRLARHKKELLTFLYEEDVDYHNNHAEQQIRPDVIFRKITNGNRSPKGVECHNVITSILQTARLNKIDPIATFENILLRAKQYPLLSALSPP